MPHAGRPKLDAKDKRTVRRQVGFTPDEWQAVQSAMTAHGYKDFSAYMRAKAMGEAIRPRAAAVNREAIFHLGKIGTLLNQLARRANSNVVVQPDEMDTTLAEVRAAIAQVAGIAGKSTAS